MNEPKKDKEQLQKEQATTAIEIELTYSSKYKEIDIQERLNASYLPSSSVTDIAYRMMIAGKSGLGELPERIESLSKGAKEAALTRPADNIRELTQQTHSGEDTIVISNLNALLEGRQNSPARKIFLYTLSEIINQALAGHNVIRSGVIISYQGLVDAGIYKKTLTAKRGLVRAFDLLSSIKVKGYVKHGKSQVEQVKASVLFYDMESTGKGSVLLKINDTLNWGYIAQQYALLPNAYFRLNPTAADLLYYIFNQARINIDNIVKNKGEFNISFKAIHNFLCLPSIQSATNPTTQIKRPIEKAIEEIEDNASDTLYIKMITPTDYNSITEYLENGYIKIILNPDFMQGYYSPLVKKWNSTKQKQLDRKQKNLDIAKQRALQKKLEAADDTKKE